MPVDPLVAVEYIKEQTHLPARHRQAFVAPPSLISAVIRAHPCPRPVGLWVWRGSRILLINVDPVPCASSRKSCYHVTVEKCQTNQRTPSKFGRV